MSCMYEQNDCSKVPEPVVRQPACVKNYSSEVIDVWLLEETWFVTHGYNPIYDCFKCQKLTFDYDWSNQAVMPLTINTVYDLKATNGTHIWNDQRMSGVVEIEGSELILHGRDNGLDNEIRMNVLLLTSTTLIVSYCGQIPH